MNTLRKFVAQLSREECCAIHEDYCEFEKKGMIGDGALRKTTNAFLQTINHADSAALTTWMDQLVKEVWRRFALKDLES
ncbi:hypothetical protein [Roseibium sp. Sym1]|uniref:hypothetical protein n=1 Tax=Roseibium sp. Sym1 TaxID=3016006 RepID=UPI0022B30DF1|nr:hypothetical protein [Roseibium sp. Sym1]